MATEELIARLHEEGEHETYPPATEDAVAQTEGAVGIKLPPSFRTFVTHYSNGAYLFLMQEVLAVGSGNAQIGSLQQNVGGGFPAEAGAEIPAAEGDPVSVESLIPFSLDSNGNCWCFLTDRAAEDGEYRVAYCDIDAIAYWRPSALSYMEVSTRDGDVCDSIRRVWICKRL